MPYGSSPRTRGTRKRARRSRCFAAVHPRARGEHFRDCGTTCAAVGSSPRTRGTRAWSSCRQAFAVHPRARGEHSKRRSSRCRAGSSPRTRGTQDITVYWASDDAVHPRARGEHDRRPISSPMNDGSSPRPRGTHRCGHRLGTAMRFIPAHAGNTVAMPSLNVADERFIPAHAGNTSRPARSALARPVHPRARGEHGSG